MARGYTKALTRADAGHLRGGPVPVGPPRGERLHRGAAREPRPARDRGGAAAPGPRRRVARAAARGPAPGDAGDAGHRAGPGRGLRHREPRGDAGLRARQGLRHRRHLGDGRLRQLQPALVDPRLRALRGRRRPGRGLRPPAAADPGRRAPRPHPGARGRPARGARRLRRAGRHVRGVRGDGRAPARRGTTAARSATDPRAGCAGCCRRSWAGSGVPSPTRSTCWPTTPTAAPAPCAAGTASDRAPSRRPVAC